MAVVHLVDSLIYACPEAWVPDEPRVTRNIIYRYATSGRVLHAEPRHGIWILSCPGGDLGMIPRHTQNALEDLQTTTGPAAQAVLDHWVLWMQVQLHNRQAPAGDYAWDVANGVVVRPSDVFMIALPEKARAEMQGLAVFDVERFAPALHSRLHLRRPATRHAQMELLHAAQGLFDPT